MPQFDVEAARKAGYSDDEILSHLTSTRKFDVNGAVSAGYSKADIINHLATSSTVKPAPAPIREPSLVGGFLSEAGKNAKRLVGAVLDTTGGQQVSTGMESTGHPVLDIARGVLSGGVPGPSGITMASGPAAVIAASPAGQIAQAGGGLIRGAMRALTDKPREPISAITKALKPLATNTDFAKHAELALPEIKAAEAQLGKPIESVEDLSSGIRLAKKNLWAKYETIRGPQAQRGIDASPIAEAIERSIPLKLKVQNPEGVKKIQELADTYRRPFTLAELDDMLTTSNAELAGYYGKYPAARTVAEHANPDIAQNVAEARALRNLIYKQLDSESGGQVVRELKQRYGSLINMEKEAQRRLNVAARQNPNSLSEQLSRWQAAMQIGKAAVTFPARPIGALGDVASAYAGRQVATALKEANSTDAIIANVFKNFTKTPNPLNYAPVRPAGLLGPGPIVTPPPADSSFVRGVPAQPAQRLTRGLLPSYREPIITPPPADPSAVRGVPGSYPLKDVRKVSGLANVGAALPKTSRTLDQLIGARLAQFKEIVESGATEMTGKVIRDEAGAIVGRHGGGMKVMFPELANIPEGPSEIAAAIQRGSGPLYERLKKAVADGLAGSDALSSDIAFGFGSSGRAGALEEARRRLR